MIMRSDKWIWSVGGLSFLCVKWNILHLYNRFDNYGRYWSTMFVWFRRKELNRIKPYHISTHDTMHHYFIMPVFNIWIVKLSYNTHNNNHIMIELPVMWHIWQKDVHLVCQWRKCNFFVRYVPFRIHFVIWGLRHQEQIFQVGINNHRCNYLSLPEIPAFCTTNCPHIS